MNLPCILDYVLVGGTALSIQISHRLSEDLDFCKWTPRSTPKSAIPFRDIETELRRSFKSVATNPIDFDQVDYLINGEVKFQFFNEVGYELPTSDKVTLEGNLTIAPIATIAAMKVKTMFQRSAFRDYYDVFAIVKGGHIPLLKVIELGCFYDKRLTREMVVKRLTDYKKFREEKSFPTLSPKYKVSVEEIGKFFEEEFAKIEN